MGFLDDRIDTKKSRSLEARASRLLSCSRRKKRKKKNRPARVSIKYKEYIRSPRWHKRRREYYSRHPKECAVCKARWKIGLHHLTYKNLGNERDEDLVALCWAHHEEYHEKYGAGDYHLTHQFIIEAQEEIEAQELLKRI